MSRISRSSSTSRTDFVTIYPSQFLPCEIEITASTRFSFQDLICMNAHARSQSGIRHGGSPTWVSVPARSPYDRRPRVEKETTMRKIFAMATFLIALVGGAAAASAHSVRYVSKHPLPRKVGHGFCYINVPHFHDYQPSDPRLYRQVDGQYYFVGDPAPFDYEGPRYSYYGAHPIADVDVHFGAPTYCYLRGPHYHWYAPPPQAQFEMKGGAYWYVGNYEPVYYSERPRYVAINDAYAPVVYTRPVVDVAVAPPAFHGEIVAVGPGFRAGAVVGGPPPPVVYDRHDNGRHNGWYKHGRGGPPPAAGGWRGAPQPAPG